MEHKNWLGFTPGAWQDEINVRDFIQTNYIPYEGDASFLAKATERTNAMMQKVQNLFTLERQFGGVLDIDTDTVTSLTSYNPGYVDKDNELIVGLQTNRPLKRGVNPFGGMRMVRQACEAYGYKLSRKVEEEFRFRTTHNDGVFRAYSDEMRKARKCHVITGLPDAYGRGRIIGDYRRVALYGVDRLIEQKKKDGITYFVCDIKLTDVSQLRTAFAGDDFRSGIYEAVSDIAGRYSPVLAINADFCRYHREGVIIRNGETLRKQNIKKHHLLVVDEDGNLSAQTDRSGKQGLVANKLEQANTWQTFEFGPVLVENGEAAELPLKSFYINCNKGYLEPRTGIGQIGPLHYIVIVVDGRRDGYSTGADMPTFQQLFLEEGAQFAFNLDGGGSTTLYFLGEVINMPSGGKERSVSDVIMFMANPQ